MKFVLLLFFLPLPVSGWCQNYILPYGEYMDTTMQINPKCHQVYPVFYYQVKTKYPVSTMTLLADVKTFMQMRGSKYAGTGYITLRFLVDCEGIIHKIRVLQTDDNYQSYRFDKKLVNDLNDYIHTLDRWEKGLSAYQLENVNYIAYLSFKIKNGEVVNVIH
ncbi:hypothetical protein [Dyadobacter psychrotolerans]|uniref:TonB C-terminal domain-containing protein n=1 Tax=Dyadobacter psychrotolerans TaxID=2541721 RepID=A0A4R5DQI3_9BACT|nr:hypothetical protein [Dyadobacter psychrotolerans]TDE16529.1 hypothetical protein E0F88_09840 [Dyadobacter psychrotolerans]